MNYKIKCVLVLVIVIIVIIAGYYAMKNTKLISGFLQKPKRSDLHDTWSMKEEFDKLKKRQEELVSQITL